MQFAKPDVVYVHEKLFGPGYCHMFSTNRRKLHAMARDVGCTRLRDVPYTNWLHYDLTRAQRASALILGAELGSGYTLLEVIAWNNGQWKDWCTMKLKDYPHNYPSPMLEKAYYVGA